MNIDAEQRMNERRNRLLNIVRSLQDKIDQLEFENEELLIRDRQREAIMKDQAIDLKRLSRELKRLKSLTISKNIPS